MEFNTPNINYVQWLISLIFTYLPNIIFSVIILIVGLILVKITGSNVHKLLLKTKIDQAITIFLVQILNIVLIIFVIIVTLTQMGISTTPLTAAVTALLVGIGMSLRTSTNIIVSGIMIVSTRPFKIGEFVDVGGTTGTVKTINFIFCTLYTRDGREIKIPNNLVTSRIITNFSRNELRRHDFIVGVSYNTNLIKAKSVLEKIISSNKNIIQCGEKAPIIGVDELADSSVNLLVRYWTKNIDFQEVKWQLTEQTKIHFDKNNIEIPFPQRKVHISS